MKNSQRLFNPPAIGSSTTAAQIAVYAADVRAVLLVRLGPVVWERSVSQASSALEELEETARCG